MCVCNLPIINTSTQLPATTPATSKNMVLVSGAVVKILAFRGSWVLAPRSRQWLDNELALVEHLRPPWTVVSSLERGKGKGKGREPKAVLTNQKGFGGILL